MVNITTLMPNLGANKGVNPQGTKRKYRDDSNLDQIAKKAKSPTGKSRSTQSPSNKKVNKEKSRKVIHKNSNKDQRSVQSPIKDDGQIVGRNTRSRSRSKSKDKQIIDHNRHEGEGIANVSDSNAYQNEEDNILDYEDDLQDDNVGVNTSGVNLQGSESDTGSLDDADSDTEDNQGNNNLPNNLLENHESSNTDHVDDNSSDDEVSFTDRDQLLARKIQRLREDPQYQQIIEQLTEERVRQKKNKKESKTRGELEGNEDIHEVNMNNSRNMYGSYQQNNVSGMDQRVLQPFLAHKSLSDSTLYTPALRLETEQNVALNQISNFVENIRLESQKNSPNVSRHGQRNSDQVEIDERDERDGRDRRGERSHGCVRSQIIPVENKEQGHSMHDGEAREVMDRVLLDAERFKATLVAPKGMLPIQIDSHVELLRKLDNDNDFFHVSCHIDPLIRSKIEKGEFVDLDKLLPRPKSAGGQSMDSSTQRVELMMKDGHSFFGTPSYENRINGVRKWDQAFRIYATIYTQANPHRSSEIWQYVDIIHTAANTYQWENVAYYDFTFRQLMASKPWRSWAKTYTQGWNIALKDPTFRTNNVTQNSVVNGGRSIQNSGRDWRDNCCWRFNKNRCNKAPGECHFDHRCTYCGVWNHSFYNCRKRQRKQSGGNGGVRSPEHKKGGGTQRSK